MVCLSPVDVVAIVDGVAIIYDHFLMHMLPGFAMRGDDGPYRVVEFRILELRIWVAIRSLFHHGINSLDLQVLVHVRLWIL